MAKAGSRESSSDKRGQKKPAQEMEWSFETKENYQQEEYGNFNTPIIMKLCSKFNKQIQSGRMKAIPTEVSEVLAAKINSILGEKEQRPKECEKWPMVFSEVSKITTLNGFLNIYFANPTSPFADRIQVVLKKKQLNSKDKVGSMHQS